MWIDYIDHDVLKVGVLGFLFTAFLSSDSKRPWLYLTISLFVWSGLNLVSYVNIREAIQTNTAFYKNGAVLLCKTDDKNEYRVTNKEWKLVNDESFLKDSLLIRADKCEVK